MQTHPVNLLFALNDLNAPRFISIRNYRNANGEKSNYLLIAAVSYQRAVQKDIERLNRVRYTGHKEVARRELLEVLIRNQSDATRTVASEAQIAAYAKLGGNSRVHVDSRSILVWAFLRSKTVIEKGTYKPSNPGMMVKLKNEIKKELRLSSCNFRQFKLQGITECRLNGQTLEIVS
jgi:hypothetical protein